MKNNKQNAIHLQQLNCQKMPLFESLTLDQQDSVVGGLALTIQGVSLTKFISIGTHLTGIEPDEID